MNNFRKDIFKKNRKSLMILLALLCVMIPERVYAMHIMEGFLPPVHAAIWTVISLPFVVIGAMKLKNLTNKNKGIKIILAMAAAFTFVLSALKFPSVTGSCSHPTGIAFGAILFGPFVMALVGVIVLLFQAILLAHGGLTTLGANTFSMAIVGAFVGYGVYTFLMKNKANKKVSIFVAAFLADLLTYVTTSVQLALAFPGANGGFMESFTKFAGIFAVTQLPLAVIEAAITVVVFNMLESYAPQEIAIIEGGSKNE